MKKLSKIFVISILCAACSSEPDNDISPEITVPQVSTSVPIFEPTTTIAQLEIDEENLVPPVTEPSAPEEIIVSHYGEGVIENIPVTMQIVSFEDRSVFSVNAGQFPLIYVPEITLNNGNKVVSAYFGEDTSNFRTEPIAASTIVTVDFYIDNELSGTIQLLPVAPVGVTETGS